MHKTGTTPIKPLTHEDVKLWEQQMLLQALAHGENRALVMELLSDLFQPPLRIYTMDQAAELVGCSTKLLEQFRRSGELQVLKVGSLVRILEEDLRRFLEERREINLLAKEVL